MPGFWTVLKWMLAITIAPILVWLAIVLVVAATVIVNRDNAPPPAPRSARHGAR
jgi:hypothetical protein